MHLDDRPRVANLAGRATLLWDGGFSDVERASGGAFRSDPQSLFDEWPRFDEWLDGVGPEEEGAPSPGLLGPPVPRPGQIFAIGLNYREHSREAGYDTSGLPQVFTKFPSCLTGPFETVVVPSDRLDWEVELVVVLGRSARKISEAKAWDHVAALMVGQDLSARDVQLSGAAPQWSLGKSFAGFGPTGPYLTRIADCEHVDDLELISELNGEIVQRGRSSELIWTVPELIARLSSVCELRSGDLIFTGTPAGVGNRMTPPRYLKPGDRLSSRIGGLGEIITEFSVEE